MSDQPTEDQPVPDPIRSAPVLVPQRTPTGTKVVPPRLIRNDDEAQALIEEIRRSGANRTNRPPPEAPPLRERVIVIETVYHQSADGQTTAYESRHGYQVVTDEQPCIRKTRAAKEWTPLDTGWVNNPGLIVVTNEEGKFSQTNPTPEEKAAADRLVLEIACQPEYPLDRTPARLPNPIPILVVAPGRDARFSPTDVRSLRVRCLAGEARYTTHAYPK